MAPTHHAHETDMTPARRDPQWVLDAVEAIQAGRDVEHHFARLARHFDPICRSQIRRLYPEGEVDDLAQDVLIRVYRGIGNFRREASFNTWLLSIVKNVIRNAIRDSRTDKAKTQRAAESLDTLIDGAESDGAPLDLESAESDPLDIVLDEERMRRLEGALDELPARMRQALELFLFHGFSQREIAAAQKTTVGTVKKQIGEGRKRLRVAVSTLTDLFSLFIVLLFFVG